MAEYRKEISGAVVVAILLAALAGGIADYSFPRSAGVRSQTTGGENPGAQFVSSLEAFVSGFHGRLMLDAGGTGLDGSTVASLKTNLSATQDNYTRLNLLYKLNFRGITTTFKALNSELVLVSSLSAQNSTVIELNATDGAQVCPEDFSGWGAAAWDAATDTCALTQTQEVGPTLCMGVSSGGCVLVAALRYRVDSGVTFNVNVSDADVCVYSVFDNYGVVNFLGHGGVAGLCNYGIIDNYGTINMNGYSDNQPYNGGGVINNFAGGVITNGGTFSNGGTVNNFGTFISTDRLEECISGSIPSYGTINNYGIYDNSGTIYECPSPPTSYDVYTIEITVIPPTIFPAVYVNGTLHETPYAYTSGPGDVTNITAFATFSTSPSYLFNFWSNGGGRSQEYTTVGNATLTAAYST